MRGKEFIEYDNPFDVGMTGLLGFSSGYHAMMNSDLLLMIGTDFPYQPFFPKNATIVQIDIRGEQLGRRTKLDHGLVGDSVSGYRDEDTYRIMYTGYNANLFGKLGRFEGICLATTPVIKADRRK